MLPGFRVGDLLGIGGFATVWGATRDGDGAPSALKVARLVSPSVRMSFDREAAALAAIGYPYTPELYGRGTLDDGRPYIAMEQLRGKTLATHLELNQSTIDIAALYEISAAILACLQAVHARGLLHRDMKPENVFLVGSSPLQIRLLDFGLTMTIREARESQISVHAIVGSTEYMAPEQLTGDSDIDRRADIYSFGVILYELLTLRVPFVGDRATVARGHLALRPPRPRELADVPDELEALCVACLSKDREKRPSNAEALRRDLERVCRAAGSSGSVRARPQTTKKTLTTPSQPVVLLAAELDTHTDKVTETVTRRHGFVARRRGKRYICAFVGTLDEKPADVALAAALELVDLCGAHAALHLANLRLRDTGDGRSPRVYGGEVERPERWLPTAPWRGVLLTSALASAVVPDAMRPSPEHDGFFVFTDARAQPLSQCPLIGRADVLEQAEHSLEASLTQASPVLLTVLGEGGLGKSRLAHEFYQLVQRVCPEARVGLYRMPRRPYGGHSDIGAMLACVGISVTSIAEQPDIVRCAGDALRAAVRAAPVALIVDDFHHGGVEALDLVEYATLDGADLPLWLVVIADPRLENRRPQWGLRAQRHDRITLLPLPEDAAMALCAELLRPAEYPPAATLREFAGWSGGNPFYLAELVRALKTQGLVRKRDHGDSWYLVTTDLEKLPAIPVGQWLATRKLDGLPVELAACARLCSVLGATFRRDELAWVQDLADQSGTATSRLDADVGLAELHRLEIIAPQDGETWVFQRAVLADALYKLLDSADRLQLHRHALDFWRNRDLDDPSLESLARHAAGGGFYEEASRAYLTLGDRMREAHRYTDADYCYTQALDHGHGDIELRAGALAGRGKVRYRMQRATEALSDLRAAREHASALGNENVVAGLLLEEATALDWADQYADSANRVEMARILVEKLRDRHLETRLFMAQGRSHWRNEQFQDAISLLDRAARRAAKLGDHETRVIALLLLPLALIFANQWDEAQRRFEEVITLCEEAHDDLHLCAAHGNRLFLWRNQPELAMQDLRKANQLARRIGQATAERVTTHNLAEILFWSGDDEESLALARRGFVLQKRFLSQPLPDDALLVARIHAARRELDDVDELLTWIRENVSPKVIAPSHEMFTRMLELVASPASPPTAWQQLSLQAREKFPLEEHLEVFYFRIRAAADGACWADAARAMAEATTMLETCPVWQARFAELTRRLQLAGDRIARPVGAALPSDRTSDGK